MINLKAKLRTKFRKELRKSIDKDVLPAELYGKEIENKHLYVQKIDFKKVLSEVGESGIVVLDIDGQKITTIIRGTQRTPLGEMNHIDFYAVKKGEKIRTEVALNFIGEPPAIKEKGGVLIKSLNVLEIEALPSELPNSIDIDLSGLEDIRDSIHIKDINISSGVRIFESPEIVIASISAPNAEEEPEEKVEETTQISDKDKDDSKSEE